MALDYTVTPLPLAWPGKATPSWARKRPQFKTIWTRALALLEREIRHLGGKNVRIAVDVDARHIRHDGGLRADARPRSPAVIVLFDTRAGTLQFPCDTFTYWQENVDAIARALEALRLVDRYGVQQGRQYTGFKALPAATAPTMDAEQAAANLASFQGGLVAPTVKSILAGREAARTAVRLAMSKAHPDAGGSAELFAAVQEAKRVLEAHHGGTL